ncbi:MAG TPA: RNA methyltransferase [Terriglobales bacterium]|nr:RNA methyltransferase [Terriglobales bacterium]
MSEFRQAFRAGLLADADGEPKLAIEGPRLIGEAIRSGYRIETALFSRTGLERLGAKLLPQLSKHTQTAVAEDKDFAGAMDVEHPQGAAALVRYPAPKLDDVFGKGDDGPALVVAAAEMQDPGNLGTLIRAADAFGATGVVALADTVNPFHPKAVRAAAGSLFHLPVVGKVTAEALIAACRRRSVRLLATSARGDAEAITAGLAEPLCFVIGQEAAGVPRDLQRAADAIITIPMTRAVESLNAGVAGAILLYEAARQRRAAGPA